MNIVEQIESIRATAASLGCESYWTPKANKKGCHNDRITSELAKVEALLKEAGPKGMLRSEVRATLGFSPERFTYLCQQLDRVGRYIVKPAREVLGDAHSKGARMMYSAEYKT